MPSRGRGGGSAMPSRRWRVGEDLHHRHAIDAFGETRTESGCSTQMASKAASEVSKTPTKKPSPAKIMRRLPHKHWLPPPRPMLRWRAGRWRRTPSARKLAAYVGDGVATCVKV